MNKFIFQCNVGSCFAYIEDNPPFHISDSKTIIIHKFKCYTIISEYQKIKL